MDVISQNKNVNIVHFQTEFFVLIELWIVHELEIKGSFIILNEEL